MGKFEIKTRKNGEFQFNLKSGNGQTILTSEGYTSKSACENGIHSVKKNCDNESAFELKTASNGKAYFNLKASNGQIIGTSEMYEDEGGAKKGIQSVMENAPEAAMTELK